MTDDLRQEWVEQRSKASKKSKKSKRGQKSHKIANLRPGAKSQGKSKPKSKTTSTRKSEGHRVKTNLDTPISDLRRSFTSGEEVKLADHVTNTDLKQDGLSYTKSDFKEAEFLKE